MGSRMLYEMRLVGLAIDPFSNSPIVILKDKASADEEDRLRANDDDEIEEDDDGEATIEVSFSEEGDEDEDTDELDSQEHILPIWIGEAEANAIAMELLGIVPARPMTHDLLKSMLSALGAEVQRVIVTELRDNTFYASIEVMLESGELKTIDSRPSDALALALRCKATIYVDESVLEQTRQGGGRPSAPNTENDESQPDNWQDLLDQMSTDNMNKYKQ